MLYLNHFKTEEDLIQAIKEYIYFYNYKRFQKRLNHRALIEYRISMAVYSFSYRLLDRGKINTSLFY